MNTVTIPVPHPNTFKRGLLKIAGLILLVYVVYVVRDMWVPLGLAFLLAMILDPIVDRMEMRGWSRAKASAFIFGSFLLIAIGLCILAYPFVVDQVAALQKGFERYFPDPSHAGLLKSFRDLGASPSIANASASAVENAKSSVQKSTSLLGFYGMSIFANVIWVVIVPIVAFYALRDFHIILAKGLLLVPKKRRDLVQTAVTEVTGIFGKYLRGLAIVSALNGIATGTLLAIIHVPGALILGLVAGILYSVPYIGALVTLALTACVAFVGGGPNMLMWALGLSVLLHQIIFDQIISPRILGANVGLHPILSIIALLAGNLLLGIVGMILAVPVAACIQIGVLAVLPKLSQEIEIQAPTGEQEDTVASLEKETKEDHQRVAASDDIHAAVTAAVESIEQGADEPEGTDEPPTAPQDHRS